MISFRVCIHRSCSGSGHHFSSGASKPKKPCVEELSNRQASHERVVPPKKRVPPHVRRSKRATSPGALRDVDWDMLEREDDEQPLKHGKGPVERYEREASPYDEFEVNISDDEYDYEEDGVPSAWETDPRLTILS